MWQYRFGDSVDALDSGHAPSGVNTVHLTNYLARPFLCSSLDLGASSGLLRRPTGLGSFTGSWSSPIKLQAEAAYQELAADYFDSTAR